MIFLIEVEHDEIIYQARGHVEQEGKAFAGCLEGMPGQAEAVGHSVREVIKSLHNSLSLLVEYHAKHGTIHEFKDNVVCRMMNEKDEES